MLLNAFSAGYDFFCTFPVEHISSCPKEGDSSSNSRNNA